MTLHGHLSQSTFRPVWVLYSTVQCSHPRNRVQVALKGEHQQRVTNICTQNSNKIVELQKTLGYENRCKIHWGVTGNRGYFTQSATQSHPRACRTILTEQPKDLATVVFDKSLHFQKYIFWDIPDGCTKISFYLKWTKIPSFGNSLVCTAGVVASHSPLTRKINHNWNRH